MKYIVATILLTLSFIANAQLIDDGSSYNEWREINGNTVAGQSQGTLTTTATSTTATRTLETISLACAYCVSNTEITNLNLRINADAQGRNLFNGTALVYTNIPWAQPTTVNGIVITTSNTTSFIETANTQIAGVPGARLRAILYTTSGASYTTPFVKFASAARNVIPVTPGIISPTKIRIEIWNLNKIVTNFKVETINLSNPTNTCTQ